MREDHFCYSLSGVSVPIITITSNVDKVGEQGSPVAIQSEDFGENDLVPVNKYKKYIIVCARVHPGESVASFIMEGFLDFITGPSKEAIDLRRNIVFKVVPMINPDGVIAGNYRSSLSGNDLNRKFSLPNPKLHPEVAQLKTLVNEIISKGIEGESLRAYIDIHGHSRKKSVFMYGPEYPL